MVVLICTSLVGEDGKHLSMCFFAISISSSPSLEIRFQIRQLLSLHCFSRSCHTAGPRDGTPDGTTAQTSDAGALSPRRGMGLCTSAASSVGNRALGHPARWAAFRV